MFPKVPKSGQQFPKVANNWQKFPAVPKSGQQFPKVPNSCQKWPKENLNKKFTNLSFILQSWMFSEYMCQIKP